METPNQPQQTKEQQKKGGAALWISLLTVSVILNIIQWKNHASTVTNYEQKVDTLVVERVNVEKELADTKMELNKYQGISSNLDSLLKDANGKIDEFEKKVKTLTRNERNTTTLNKKLKEQLADLQGLRDEYLTRIDSLLTANKTLTAEKTELNTKVESLSKNLATTVNTASVLRAEYFKTSSFKRKSSGKYVESTLAKRTNKLQICLDVLENKIAKQGERTVYLKITEPGGKVIGNRAEGSNSTKLANGDELLYTASAVITYTGEKQNVCMSYEEQKDKMFPAGAYTIEAYIDGKLAGSSSYTMK
jgi:chromosome segregation ATPase